MGDSKIINDKNVGEDMKKLLIGMLAFTLLLAGCSYGLATRNTPAPRENGVSQIGYTTTVSPAQIRLVSTNPQVRRGGNMSIMIQGQPGVHYNITSTFRQGGRNVTASDSKPAGPDGTVVWSWNVRADTQPGVYPLTISGGGRILITSYTVTG